jgi:hypothetical protein
MKTFKLFTLGTIVFFFIQACSDKPKTETAEKMGRGCFDIYELNVLDNHDTINRQYGDGTKEGHWIIYAWIDPKEKAVGENNPGRSKITEGYYKDNKKEGFWKSFNKDGTLNDSVEYKNDFPVRK